MLMTAEWATVDDFQLAPGLETLGIDVAADAAGNVYVVGFVNDFNSATPNVHGIVREKRSGGDTWETVLDLADARFSGVAVGPSGNLYVWGEHNAPFRTPPGPLLLERPAGKDEFTVIDQYEGRTGGYYDDVTVDAAGNINDPAYATQALSWLMRLVPPGGNVIVLAHVDKATARAGYGRQAYGIKILKV